MSTAETTITVLLCSKSNIKKDATENYFNKYIMPQSIQPTKTQSIPTQPTQPNFIIDTIECGDLKLPSQPLNCTLSCAKVRLDYGKRIKPGYDYYVSIENGLWDIVNITDECQIIIEHKNIIADGLFAIDIPSPYDDVIKEKTKFGKLVEYNDTISGYKITLGELIQEDHKNTNPKNWMKEYGTNRKDMIYSAFDNAFDNLKLLEKKAEYVLSKYKSYQDFPKPGVIFQDIFAVLADGRALSYLTDLMAKRYERYNIDYIVGLESRGFFGVLMAQELGVGFVPIRKANKLPGKTESIEYGTEYSKDKCEIQTDMMPKGSKIVIFDDLIATGGSLKASVDLVERVGGVVVDCCVLREVVGLRSKAEIKMGRPYTVLLVG